MRSISVAIFVAFISSGCATQVASREELFANAQDRKACYTYDTTERNFARNAPTTVGLGVVGGLFPPLMLVTLAASAGADAADQATLPTKCGLTFADATNEAISVSFYEQATAIWRQRSGNAGITAKFLNGNSDCSNHKVTSWRVAGDQRKTFVETLEVCRNDQGEPVVKGPTTREFGPDQKTYQTKAEGCATAGQANNQPAGSPIQWAQCVGRQ